MTNEIENQVSANIEKVEVKLRKLGIKLVSMMISLWLIVGSIAMGLVFPAYLVKQVARFQRTKEAEAGPDRISQYPREPSVSVSESAYQQHQHPRTGYSGENQANVQSGIRNFTNTLNEARYFVRSAADLGVR